MKETYQQAKVRLLRELASQGWGTSPHLKIPHATSPNQEIRVWFKPQALYFTLIQGEKRHHFGDARSIHVDFRGMTMEQLTETIQKLQYFYA